jgi:putative effector of murein hydrolase
VTGPDRPRDFRAPLVWITAPLAIATCIVLMAYLPFVTWIRFGVWLLIGLALYFARLLRRPGGVTSSAAPRTVTSPIDLNAKDQAFLS